MIGHGCSRLTGFVCATALLAGAVPPVVAQTTANTTDPALGSLVDRFPDLRDTIKPATEGSKTSGSLQILVVLTALTLIPTVLITMTCFTRIIIVLALLRQALATPQLPPGQVLLGLSLFLSLLVMSPTLQKVNATALAPYFNNEISQTDAVNLSLAEFKQFMYHQIDQADNHEDIYLFLEYSQNRTIPASEQVTVESVPTLVMVPAFILSELKTAFLMGFRIYLPFLVIDMVISVLLVSMGMMMLPPVLVSLPFKLILFVLADGWRLVTDTLLSSFM